MVHMRSSLIKLLVAVNTAIFSTSVMALNIFVCEPEWQALIAAHAPDANIYSATTMMQDPHFVQARPSLIAKMRKADMAMCSGAELEIGWLPMLQVRSANAKVQNNATGMLYAANFAKMLDTHTHVDRSMGDIHAYGNPHLQFAANDMLALSDAVVERLQQIDPDNAMIYQRNGLRFRSDWTKKLVEWKRRAIPLHGKKVVSYHATYRYLFAWLGMQQVADLEPKPGISPTTAHLQSLTQLENESFDGIVYSSHQNPRAANWLHQRTQKPVIQLPLTVAKGQTLVALYDDVINSLLAALVLPQGN